MEVLVSILSSSAGAAVLSSSAFIAFLTIIISNASLHIQRKKKSAASLNLLAQYATIAIRHIESIDDQYKNESIKKNILKGDPFGEPGKNYTPFILFSEEDKLSFEQILDILQYLKNKEPECLMEYFTAQAKLDAINQSINSDFVRSLPQKRKEGFWNLHLEYRTELLEKAKALNRIIKKRKVCFNFRF